MRVSLEKMEVYQVPVPKDPVQEGNYEDDVVTDKDGNTLSQRKPEKKIPT